MGPYTDSAISTLNFDSYLENDEETQEWLKTQERFLDESLYEAGARGAQKGGLRSSGKMLSSGKTSSAMPSFYSSWWTTNNYSMSKMEPNLANMQIRATDYTQYQPYLMTVIKGLVPKGMERHVIKFNTFISHNPSINSYTQALVRLPSQEKKRVNQRDKILSFTSRLALPHPTDPDRFEPFSAQGLISKLGDWPSFLKYYQTAIELSLIHI